MSYEFATVAETLIVERYPTTRRRVQKQHLQPHLQDKAPAVSITIDANQLLGHLVGTRQHWRVKCFMCPSVVYKRYKS